MIIKTLACVNLIYFIESSNNGALVKIHSYTATKRIQTRQDLSNLFIAASSKVKFNIDKYKDNKEERIQHIRQVSKSIHEAWLDNLISEDDNTNESDNIPIEMYLQVSLGTIYTESNPNGYTVFMDIGSSHAVIPLNNQTTELTDTFKGIKTDNFMLFSYSIYYGNLVKCPEIFKKEFYCTSASYVSDASNSVVGVEKLRTHNGNGNPLYVTAEYKLNLLRGSSFGEVGVFGIGFGLRGFKTTPFLIPFYRTSGPQTILFKLYNNNTPSDKGYSVNKFVGTIHINTTFNEEDYKWAYFDKRGKNYSLNVMYGVYISTEGQVGVFDMSDDEFGNIRSGIKRDLGIDFKYTNIMFDSGTCGFILDTENTKRILFGLKRVYKSMLLVEKYDDSVFLCWPNRQTALNNGYLSPSQVYINILLENIRVAVSLNGISFFDSKIKDNTYQCLSILVMDRTSVQIIGYPIWKKLDLLWDANGGRVGIKNGITNN